MVAVAAALMMVYWSRPRRPEACPQICKCKELHLSGSGAVLGMMMMVMMRNVPRYIILIIGTSLVLELVLLFRYFRVSMLGEGKYSRVRQHEQNGFDKK